MEVSAVPSNPNFPEGGDYGKRAPDMSYVTTANDSGGDYYPSPPRGQNSTDYAQRQYLPHEREFVVSQGSCSHCHCCQRPTEYQNQPTGSRGERSDQYPGTVPLATEAIQEARSRTSISQVPPPCNSDGEVPASSNSHANVPPANEQGGSAEARPSPNQAECCSVPYNSPETLNIGHHPEQNCCSERNNNTCRQQTVNVPLSRTCSLTESPFIGEERHTEKTSAAVPETSSSEPNFPQRDTASSAPSPTPAQSLPVLRSPGPFQDTVSSLMTPQKPRPARNEGESQKFTLATLTHLNFKEKQLAMSAVKKAAANINCLQMFQDKDKQNRGIIGKRDFQMVMDRIGVLRGMSSREVDAVFKGFATETDTEIDYKKFSSACRHAIDNDHRLARMTQK